MIEIREILRLWLAGRGLREVARLSGTDRKTVRRYVDRARACGLDREGDAGQLTDELLAAVIAGVRPSRPNGRSEAWETIAAQHEQIEAWLLRPVYGHAKQGASYGHTKISGRQILRKGLSPLLTTISTQTGAPVIAGARLRAGRANSAKGAARMIAQAVATARAAGVTGELVVPGDSAYGTGVITAACRRAGARFSLAVTKNRAMAAAIEAIGDDAWTPVCYPGAVRDPDTGDWISDAEVAETSYTAFASTPHAVSVRLIVRRVKDARYPEALFPVWRYHPFITDTDDPAPDADLAHRRHAIIETVFADLIDGPLAHIPSGRFGANSDWLLCSAIAHNLLRATGVLAGGANSVARGTTLRRRIVTIPARLARPQRRPVLHLPSHWPWVHAWKNLWHNIIGAFAQRPPPLSAPT